MQGLPTLFQQCENRRGFMTVTHVGSTTELVENDIAHVLHPNTVLDEHERSGPLVIDHAKGVRVWDVEGNEYIDGFAGLWNVLIGYGREELAEVAAQQIKRLSY